MKLKHLLMIRVDGECSSTITQRAHNIANVLVERSPEVKKMKIRLERYCPREFSDGFLILMAVHQNCKSKRVFSLREKILEKSNKFIFFSNLPLCNGTGRPEEDRGG